MSKIESSSWPQGLGACLTVAVMVAPTRQKRTLLLTGSILCAGLVPRARAVSRTFRSVETPAATLGHGSRRHTPI